MQATKYFNNIRTLREDVDYIREWAAVRVDGGYILEADGVAVNTVNSGKPRVFKSLEVLQRYTDKLGVDEFVVREFVVRRVTKH